jgi:hypothetical protein
MNPRDARVAFALLKIRQSQISKAIKAVQPYTDQEPGDKNAARLGHARLGKVAMTEPQTKPVVTDAELFTKYVKDVRPDEIVDAVRASYQVALFEQFVKTGKLQDWDGNEVPGVAFDADTPQQRFYADEGADDLLAIADAGDLPVIEDIDLAGLLGIPRRDDGADGAGGDPG